jgi:hypothetical protein
VTVDLLADRYGDDDEEREALRVRTLARLDELRRLGGKVCPRCEERKPLDAFGVDRREKDGLYRACRACRASGLLLL